MAEAVDNHRNPAEAPREDIAQSLGVDPGVGLSQAEVERRRREAGYNEVSAKKKHPLWRFARKFWGLSAWMLELILVLSWLLHKYSDLYIVTGLLVINAVLSFIQEQRAEGAVEALRSRLRVNARVLRDGRWQVVPARELVPGDVVRLRPGDFVPADIQLAEGTLGVDQSVLTGESMEVEREPGGTLYSGSIVRRGEATGVVTGTGARTYYGRTTELVQIARPKLHSEEVISRVVKWLFVIVGALLAVALVFTVQRGISLLEMLPLMLILLLGAVPVALPVMFTVSMAVGSLELARKGVLVTRLSASDDAATMDVLCVDKTGTITQNRLAVASIQPTNGAGPDEVLLYGALASQEANHDPIDMAFIDAARQKGLELGSYVRTGFVPFDHATRMTEGRIADGARELRAVKGAVRSVAQECQLAPEAIAGLEKAAQEAAAGGGRTLAVALGEAQAAPRLIGLVTLSDPPRADSPKLVQRLRELGVSVKMLTGDALPIARQIAQTVGLGPNIQRTADLQALESQDERKAAAVAEGSDGFAEIYPEGKYAVVKALQASGRVVGMTGDGVNDAPALRQAEVGIAVSSATDVAKGAASVVLTDEGLEGIVDLIRNGRVVYQRIATWVLNKISRTILKTAFVVFAFLITGKYVVSASAMIVMIFMTDFVKVSLATDNVRGSSQPEKWDILNLVKVATVLGVLMVVEAFGLLYIGLHHLGLGANAQALYTFSFETLFYFAMFSIFAVRERRHFWDSLPSKTMLLAVGADLVIGTLIASLGIPGMQALPLPITALVLGYAFVFSLVVNDAVKYLVVRRTGLGW